MMVAPAALAGISMATSAAGSLIQGIGAQQQAGATAAAYTYKAGVAQLNATINKQNSSYALQAGDIQAEEQGLQAGQAISETKAKQGASGFDTTTGSNAAVTKTQTAVSQFDQQATAFNAAKTAYGYDTKAVMDQAEAGLDVASASNAKTAGNIAMIGSFISGAGNVAGKWLQGTQVGIPGGGGNGPIGNFDPNNYGAAPVWS